MIDIIVNNPYRVTDLLPTSSERDSQRQKQKLATFAKVGKELPAQHDYPFLPGIQRSEANIQAAFSELEQNHNKVLSALFWFISVNQFDEMALQYLQTGDAPKAQKIWHRLLSGKGLQNHSFTSLNNYSTYILATSTTPVALKKAISFKMTFIESTLFEALIYKIVDETYDFNKKTIQEDCIDLIVKSFRANDYDISDLIDLFSSCKSNVQEYLEKKFSLEPIHSIESLIEETERKRKQEPENAYEHGFYLYHNTEKDVELLRTLLDRSSFKYIALMDQLATELNRCALVYLDNTTSERRYEFALKVFGYAKSLAENDELKKQIIENIEVATENAKSLPIEKELKYLTTILNQFQAQEKPLINDITEFIYECKPILKVIEQHLSSGNFEYLTISSGVVNFALSALVAEVNLRQEMFGKTIQYSANKVAELKNLISILANALKASEAISTLDMLPEVREHFNQNHSVLTKIHSDFSDSLYAYKDQNVGQKIGNIFGSIITWVIIIIIISLFFE